jgi:hypothetical protein
MRRRVDHGQRMFTATMIKNAFMLNRIDLKKKAGEGFSHSVLGT